MPLSQQAVQQLHEELDRGEPTPWFFDEDKDGPRVIGVPRRLEDRQSEEFGTSTHLILDVEGAERSVLLTQVLAHKLQRVGIKAGEPVGIERMPEKVTSKNGKRYWDFIVKKLEHARAELNWSGPHSLPETTVESEIVDAGDYGAYTDADAPPENDSPDGNAVAL